MKINWKGKFEYQKKLMKFNRKVKKTIPPIIEKTIINSLNKSVSPVKGQGKLASYSDSYKSAIRKGRAKDKKSISPVNLKQTGKLHRSIFVKTNILKDKRVSFTIGFKNKLADIHNRLGAGKAKTVRRMLPTEEGENFSDSIFNRIRKQVREAVKEMTK